VEIQHISDDLIRIPVPVPFPMKYVYCYVGKSNQGVTLIDAGFHYPPAQQAWREAFSLLQLQPDDVKAIYLTHYHPDHIGLAGWLQQWTGAPVFMHEVELERVNRVWSEGSDQAERIGEMCRQNGVPHALAGEIVENMKKLHLHVLPLPQLQPIGSTEVDLTDDPWQVLVTPGHSDAHTCFYQPQTRHLLAGDHLLDKITPNISLWPGHHPNPLLAYMESLHQVAALDISLVLPAHGQPIRDAAARVNDILRHHESRLAKMHEIARIGRTAYEVASVVFADKQLTAHQWRFAIAETLAHLEYLVAEGKLTKTAGPLTVYQA
jgi:glyoxylase-like metal-dependent hydrolase (beta-lactamase superfamily II)